ncbi:hypothetical protein ES703_114757 [subsurface metagenome]
MPGINVRGLVHTAAKAEAEEVTALPLPSADQLNKIVKLRSGGRAISKVYICMRNSNNGYQWVQMAIST